MDTVKLPGRASDNRTGGSLAPNGVPQSLLSGLERSLQQGDVASVREQLRNGADPHAVQAALLREGDRASGKGAECAALIRMAGRLKRLSPALTSFPGRMSHVPGLDQPITGNRPTATRERLGEAFTQSAPPSPIRDALHAYDLPALKAALQQVPDVGHAYTEEHEDVLIGMLATNDTKGLASWKRRGLIADAQQVVTAPGLRRSLKQFPYYSSKPNRDSGLCLNGDAVFEECEQPIVCRHLAVYWLLEKRAQVGGKVDYKKFTSEDGIQTAFADMLSFDEAEAVFEHCVLKSPEAHLLQLNDFGPFLCEQFGRMGWSGKTGQAKSIFLCSENHAMAMELKIKQDDAGGRSYVVNFYDPNVTSTHSRMQVVELANLKTASFFDVAACSPESGQLISESPLWIAHVLPDEPLDGEAFQSDGAAGKDLAERCIDSKPASDRFNPMQILMGQGFSGEVSRLVNRFAKEKDPDKRLALLAGHSIDDATPALYGAFGSDLVTCVKSYAEAVLESPSLSADEKCWLLECTFGERPGLHEAMALGAQRSIDAFVDLIAQSEALAPFHKEFLLEARNEKGETALAVARQSGKAGSVQAFEAAIVNATALSDAMKARLLSA